MFGKSICQFTRSTIIVLIIGVVSHLHAQTMDVATRDLLIQKLEKVLLTLPAADTSHSSVSLRLADLYSERARVAAMQELESGCSPCTAGTQDRKNALKLYNQNLAKVPEESQGKIIFHIGHLNDLLGQSAQAEATYLGLIRTSQSPKLVSEAQAALGEMYFKSRRYSLARAQFEAARKSQLNQKGLASYRIGWSHFHEGNVAAAASELRAVLRTPALLSRNSDSAVVSIDKQFQEEVSRDLATFLARLNPTKEQMQELFELSPENAKVSNIEFLATELERLGSKDRALLAWQMSQERQSLPRNRLEGHVRLSQLQLDLGNQNAAVTEFEKALGLWGQVNCTTGCEELKSRLRKFVIEWHRTTQKQPKAEVLHAYRQYLNVFSDDVEMSFWAAGLAKDLKLSADATTLYNMTVSLAEPHSKHASIHESSLLSVIEVAESTKDPVLSQAAYDQYLARSKKSDKKLEVLYQKAHALYKSEKYAEAAEALKVVADSTVKGDPKIRLQAAELSLDALAILKDSARIQEWSTHYAGKFPASKVEFQSVQRKSLLNQTAQSAAEGNSETAWALLSKVDISGADPAERTIYLKNKILLAEKTKRYSEARLAVSELLRQPGLSASDRQFALTKQGWLAELALDFRTAFSANRELPMSELKPDQKALRLAMFAELAGEKAAPHYDEYLKVTKDRESARAVAARLIRRSTSPNTEFLKSQVVLKEDPTLLAGLGLEIYAQTGDVRVLKSVLDNKQAANTAPGKTLVRDSYLLQLIKSSSAIAAMAIDTSNQSALAKGIKSRVKMIDDLENLAQVAVANGDWISQIASLSVVEREVSRFYNELIALPIPEGLTPEEEGQYLQLLSTQAAPYQVKSQDIQTKLKEMNSTGALDQVLNEFDQLQGPVRRFLSEQLIKTAGLVKNDVGARMSAAAQKVVVGQGVQPSISDIEAARKQVLADPMNRQVLLSLSQLERKMGRDTMASYLEARAMKLEENK